MKTLLPNLMIPLALCGPLVAQNLVGDANYPGLFGPSDDVTVDAPTPGVIGLTLGGNASGPLGTHWQAEAGGGASASLAGIGLVETGSQVALTGDSLEFNIRNSPDSLLGLLGTGAGIGFDWGATATFDDPGEELILTSGLIYRVTFDLQGNDNLLSSTAGLAPTFGVELLDGAGNPVGAAGGGTLVDVLGLSLLSPVVGNPVGDTRATVFFTPGAGVDGGPASLRFTGSALLESTALGIGTNYATISNVNVAAVPEPSMALLLLGSVSLLLRRRRV